jgi:hypothetical protein
MGVGPGGRHGLRAKGVGKFLHFRLPFADNQEGAACEKYAF